jgi:hypothetical protein
MAGALLNAAAFGGYAWVASHYCPEIDSWQMVVPQAPVTTSRRTPTSAMAAVITRVRSASRCGSFRTPATVEITASAPSIASTTLEEPLDRNATRLKGEVTQEVQKLKQLLRRLWRPVPAGHAFEPLADVAAEWAEGP